MTKRNTMKSTAVRAQDRLLTGSFGLDGVRRRAESNKSVKFTSLLHHVTATLLRESYYQLKKDAAEGVDEETWQDYYIGHWDRIENLRSRIHKGSYRAQPSRRAYITKEDGSQRPLGIAALEDKIAQQAICTILNRIYESDFADFSYGFRENRSQHDALDALSAGIISRKINWILDADIKGFFDNLNHEMLLNLLRNRIGDKRVLRLISKWLKTGYIEDGKRIRQETGTPQGSVISPLLANVYLHYVLDKWASWWRVTKAKGDMIIVRYADDFVIGFQYQKEAETFLADLEYRLSNYELTLHPKKTRLIEFGRYAAVTRKRKGEGKPEVFDFLGFTHMCSKNRKGYFFLRRKTISKRFKKKLKEAKDELKKRKHMKVSKTGKWLASVIKGHANYYAVPGNMDAVKEFYKQCIRHWLRTLRRRSQKGRALTWEKFLRKTEKLIPRPRLVHPFPEQRFWRQRLEVRAG